MHPDDVVERINGKALAMGLGEVSVHYRGSTGEMEDLFDITQGKRFTLLRLLPQDPTSGNQEGLLDQQIEKVLQAADRPQSPGNTPRFARGVTGADLPVSTGTMGKGEHQNPASRSARGYHTRNDPARSPLLPVE